MAAAGLNKLMLPEIMSTDGVYWMPLGLVDKRIGSPVRVTRKGALKHLRNARRRYTVHKATSKTPAPWHSRPTVPKLFHEL